MLDTELDAFIRFFIEQNNGLFPVFFSIVNSVPLLKVPD